MVGIVFEH